MYVLGHLLGTSRPDYTKVSFEDIFLLCVNLYVEFGQGAEWFIIMLSNVGLISAEGRTKIQKKIANQKNLTLVLTLLG